jgi:hypothetical protein
MTFWFALSLIAIILGVIAGCGLTWKHYGAYLSDGHEGL